MVVHKVFLRIGMISVAGKQSWLPKWHWHRDKKVDPKVLKALSKQTKIQPLPRPAYIQYSISHAYNMRNLRTLQKKAIKQPYFGINSL